MADSSTLRAVMRVSRVVDVANTVSVCCAVMLATLVLLSPIMESCLGRRGMDADVAPKPVNGHRRRACDEIYMVGEGETLNSISDKCDDPFIIERNPHIHDPDDVFPGLVIWIIPANTGRKENIPS